MSRPTLVQWSGAALIVGSLGFVGVFTYLAANFGYPEVLDQSAGDVLPTLLEGGGTLRLVWFGYAALPLVFVLGGVASAEVYAQGAPQLRG